jgi:molybdopterin-guanine dinucleotide biosynthesis protein B
MKIFGFAGWSGSGKTTLIEQLIPRFVQRRWVLMHELRGAHEPSFEEQVKRMSPCDLLLVEGFKHAPIPKLEVWRAATGEPLLHPNDPHIVAVATDVKVETKLPLLDLNDVEAIFRFILKKVEL